MTASIAQSAYKKSHEKTVVLDTDETTRTPWLSKFNPRGLPEIGFLLHLADELALLAAALLAGLLVERRALDVARQAFFFAGLLESLEELVETLVHPDFDADQALTSFQFTRYVGDYSPAVREGQQIFRELLTFLRRRIVNTEFGGRLDSGQFVSYIL